MRVEQELADVEAAERLLTAFRDERVAELSPLEGRRLSRDDDERAENLRECIRQVERGVGPAEGLDARLDALLRSPEVVRCRLRAPGLASLRRLRERLRAELNEASEEASPREYRYTGRPLKHRHEGRDLRPGDIVVLSAAQAAALADRFEPVEAAEQTVKS